MPPGWTVALRRGRLAAIAVSGLLMAAKPVAAATPVLAILAQDGHDHARDHGAASASWVAWLGRLHPMWVHFPIALLLLAPAVEVLAVVTEDRRHAWTARTGLWVGTVGALVAAPLGWFAAAGGDGGALLSVHRWLGTATAGGAVVTLIACERFHRRGSPVARSVYHGGLALLALLVVVTGHLGATLVFGDPFFG